jgi:prophage maintenance system killer protein
MADLRQKRNSLLTATDYLALSDNTLSADMTTYRQSLRDITDGLTTLDEVNAVTFPTKP